MRFKRTEFRKKKKQDSAGPVWVWECAKKSPNSDDVFFAVLDDIIPGRSLDKVDNTAGVIEPAAGLSGAGPVKDAENYGVIT